MKEFPITEVPAFSKKDRIVVVGIIGKSPYRSPNKTTPLLPRVDTNENGIKCYWDERSSIMYLHTTTYLDTKQLTELAANLKKDDSNDSEKDIDPSDWLVAAGKLATDSCRAIALVFHLSQIVILSSPTPVFDLGYLQLFKAIDAYRLDLSPKTTEALSSSNIGGNWESHGRPCCPRLLFHFHRAPRQLKRAPAALKRLEHAVEDQLYFILRKARIITNVCAKSLFAIPKNEEFVYINANDEACSARDVSSLVAGLVGLCNGSSEEPTTDRIPFKQFLQGHIDLAFNEGFDDNVGKYAMSTSFFELPSAKGWKRAAEVLTPIYLEKPAPGDSKEDHGALYDSLATDVRFSHARCAKVLPIAQASYAEGLPSHYSSQHHAHKVRAALQTLQSMARGPAAAAARRSLRDACDDVWRARRLCEALSLTHHPCVEPEHDSSTPHKSAARIISACDCGRSRLPRDDPYCVKSANCTFYERAARHCGHCQTHNTKHFPVFQPSTNTYKEASVKEQKSQEAVDGEVRVDEGSPDGWSGSPESLSPGSQRGSNTPDEKIPSSPKRYDVVAVREDNSLERIGRQWSTTEYLPGMLHLTSPDGLLPAFSSWSLKQLGASSLYSHCAGLPDHLQPGMLPHAAALVPWDCAVSRSEQAGAWRGRGRGRGGAAPLTVKIFFGYEYECPRGHRQILQSPTANTGVGSTGARLASSPVPLYVPCACRPHSLAYCARLHVVTPKAPVHVTLHPKVQPTPGGPVFIPQPESDPPIKLSSSAYWVLRFPFVYCDEKGPLPRPEPNAAHAPGKILAPMFGLAD